MLHPTSLIRTPLFLPLGTQIGLQYRFLSLYPPSYPFCPLYQQVLLAMHANVEDRGIKGDITPLMAAANGGHVKIVKLLLAHGADVNAQSSTGNKLREKEE